jgi:microcystin-dependent protein
MYRNKGATLYAALVLALALTPCTFGSEPFLGQIRLTGFNFAPRGNALCDGQILPINQNQSLYSLLGTTYGGDGRTTFALPDLRGRVPIGEGTGPGLTPRTLGSKGGEERVTLTTNQVPAHTHTVLATTERGNKETPGVHLWAKKALERDYSTETPNVNMSASALGGRGGDQPHQNTQPFQVVNYIIALQGIFPVRN